MTAKTKAGKKSIAQRAADKAKSRFRNKALRAVAHCPVHASSKKRSSAARKLHGKLSHKGRKIYSRHESKIRASAASSPAKLKKMGPNLSRIMPRCVNRMLTQQQAWSVLKFFFGKDDKGKRIPIGIGAASLTIEDREFALSLLIEAVDASYHQGFIEDAINTVKGLFGKRKKIAKGTYKFRHVLMDFANKAMQRWFAHAKGEDLVNPRIYENIRRWIWYKWGHIWASRVRFPDEPVWSHIQESGTLEDGALDC